MYNAKGSGEKGEQQLLWLLPFLQEGRHEMWSTVQGMKDWNSAPQISMVFLVH